MTITTAQQRFNLQSMGVFWLIPPVISPLNGSVTDVERLILEGLVPFPESIPIKNNLTDAVYNITQRYVNGNWVYYTELFDDRIWPTIEYAWCLDAAVGYPLFAPEATIFFDDNANVQGATSTITADGAIFASYMVGNVIRAYAGIATITATPTAETATVTINVPFAGTVQEGAGQAPLPAAQGQWSQGVPVTKVYGLSHLEGMEVTALADGAVVTGLTVHNASVTLPHAATMIVIGLPFVAQLQSLPIEPGGGGTVQGKRKNITAVTARVEQSRGFQIGTNQLDFATFPAGTTKQWGPNILINGVQTLNLIQVKDRSAQTDAGNTVPAFTGDIRVNMPGNWVKPGQVAIQQTNPLPLGVLALIPEIVPGDSDDPR